MKIFCPLISRENYQIFRLKISYEIITSFLSRNHRNFKIIKNIESVEGHDHDLLQKDVTNLIYCLA